MVLRDTPQALANWACSKVEPTDIHEANGCAKGYKRILDLDQLMKLERASRHLLLKAKERRWGRKIKVQRM